MLENVRNLMAATEWTNAVFLHIWGKTPAREHEELRRRVGHIVGVQSSFLAVLKGETPGGPPSGPPPTFDALKARAQPCHAGLREFAAELDDPGLTRIVRIPWFPEPPCVITVAQALVQVAMHSQHHRGQCMTRLRDFGGEPKNVDWIIWLWKGKPAARWE